MTIWAFGGAHRGQEKVFNLRELDLQAIVSHPKRMLGSLALQLIGVNLTFRIRVYVLKTYTYVWIKKCSPFFSLPTLPLTETITRVLIVDRIFWPRIPLCSETRLPSHTAVQTIWQRLKMKVLLLNASCAFGFLHLLRHEGSLQVDVTRC